LSRLLRRAVQFVSDPAEATRARFTLAALTSFSPDLFVKILLGLNGPVPPLRRGAESPQDSACTLLSRAHMKLSVLRSRRPAATRHDERIRSDVLDRLAMNLELDANDIEVLVTGGEVTLKGTVLTRQMKYVAHDTAEGVPGVQELHNWLHVRDPIRAEARH
jgi:hypothetical protein